MPEWKEFSSSESPLCLPPSFSSIRLNIREQMLFQDFQDGHYGGYLGYWNGTNINLPSHPDASHQVKVQSDLLSGSSGGHLGYQNGMV